MKSIRRVDSGVKGFAARSGSQGENLASPLLEQAGQGRNQCRGDVVTTAEGNYEVRLYNATRSDGEVVSECMFCVTSSSEKAAQLMGHALVLNFLNRRMLADPDGSICDPSGVLPDSTKSIWHISGSDLEELNALNCHANYTSGRGHTTSLLVDPPEGSLMGEEDMKCIMHLDPAWVPDGAYVRGIGEKAQGAKGGRGRIAPWFKRRAGAGTGSGKHS